MKKPLLILALAGLTLMGCQERKTPTTTKTDTMDSIPEGWPTDWVGESLADLGADGRIRCTILLADGYTPNHLKNYKEIMAGWSEVWPAARQVIQTMLIDYERDPKINARGNYLKITIPAEAISDGAEWSIALEKDKGDGVWDACFQGWKVVPDESQPYF